MAKRFGPAVPGLRRDRSRWFAWPLPVPLTPPFVGGYVTDFSQYQLAPNESPLLQDVIWPKGIPCLRGNWSRTGATNPLSSGTNQLAGVLAVQFPTTPTTLDLMVSDTGGKIGRATAGNAAVASTNYVSEVANAVRIPRCVYQGEVLFCAQDGVSSILRNAGYVGTPANADAGGVVFTFTAGSPLVTVTGSTNLAGQCPKGSFLIVGQFGWSRGARYRVVAVTGNSSLSLDAASATSTTLTVSSTPPTAALGAIGLTVLVHGAGQVTTDAGGNNITGAGTAFVNGAQANGKVFTRDIIYFSTGSPSYVSVAAPTTDSALPIGLTPGPASVTVNTSIRRTMPGRDACVHNQSLFVTGVDWARRRVYMFPPGVALGDNNNQVDAAASGNQDMAKWFDVSAPDAPGRVEAILSGGEPGPLLGLATEACYGVWTTYPPSPSNTVIHNIGPGLGCNDLRSAVSSEYGQFWTGDYSISGFMLGKCRSLTEGRRGREWQSLMRNRSSTAIICAWVVNGHLFVALNDASGPQSVTWCYDLVRQVWCGNITGLSPRAAHSARPVGLPQEAYVVTNETSSQQVGAVGAVALDEGNANGTNQGTFIAETPASLLGDPVGLSHPIDSKIKYELVGATAAMAMKTSDGPSTAVLETTLAVPATQPAVQRVRPISDVTQTGGFLGQQLRNFKVRLEGSGSPSTLRVHEVEVYLRQPWRRQ